MMAGSALAVGLGVAAMIGAGTADAKPGISYDRGQGNGPHGIGDQSETGAQASASDGNHALAISIRKPASAIADGEGTNNRLVAINGTATVTGEGSDNHLLVVGGSASTSGDNNHMWALGSGADAADASDQRAVAVCGKLVVSAQAADVTVSPGACGSAD